MLIKTKESMSFLQQKVYNNNYFGTPVYKTKIEDHSIFVVYEDFTLSNANYMTISIVLEEKQEFRYIHFVESGSSRGIFGFDWGAGNRRKKRMIRLLEEQKIDFEIIDQ